MPLPKPPELTHTLLVRQLRRYLNVSPKEVPESLRPFVDAVNDAYFQGDADRRMLERSMELSSRELLEANRALRRSERDYRGLFEAARDAILVLDPVEARILEVNPRASLLYGYSQEEMQGMSLGEITDLRTARKRLKEILAEGRLQPFATTHRRKDGSRMSLEVHAGLMEYRGNRAVLSIHHDVTDRIRTEREREELILKLEERQEEMERFTYTLSHDLKSPVFTILGFLGLLDRDAAEGRLDAVRKDIEQIQTAANQVRRLLEELLELSRLGYVDNKPEEIDLTEVAEEALSICAGQVDERRVEVLVAADLPRVLADHSRLLAVFQNLIDNAVKFMGETEKPQIRIYRRRDDADDVVCVADNGRGIDRKFHERVFGLFDRLETEGDGSGIGLALVQRVIEGHSGRVWVESEGAGHGSTFCFTLPRREA